MNRIFSGDIYEIVPQPNGLVFAYCKDAGEKHVMVSYQMLSLDTGRITDVAKNIYQLSKFGSNYRQIAAHCGNYVTARSLVLPNGKVFLTEDTGIALLFDVDGDLLWQGDLRYRGFAPSDLAVYQNSLWACYAEADVLLRFHLNTMREELRIGGKNSPFCRPSDLFVEGNSVFVSNPGSNKIVEVDLNSYSVSTYKEFTESVYSYAHLGNFRFVLMKSGLYVF